MDYLIGLLFGYFLREFLDFMKFIFNHDGEFFEHDLDYYEEK